VTLVVDEAVSSNCAVDANADEPVLQGGRTVGWVTSGGYAHFAEKSVALAYIPAELAQPGAAFEIEILGERRRSVLAAEPLFDPAGLRMRS
jgi:dimethylglycine dehydrogenase